MPPWWLCLGLASKPDLKEVGIDWDSFRNPVFDLPYSFSRWAIGERPIRAPLKDKKSLEHWKQSQLERFERELFFPLRSKVQFKGPIQTQSVESVRHDEYKAFALDQLGNRRTLFRFFHLTNQIKSKPGENERRATVVFFMGHGKVNQLLTDADSYQHAAAHRFAKLDYEVFVMENVGMGPTADSHLQIDRVLRLDGYGWYSVLFAHQRLLLRHVLNHPSVDSDRVGVAGVSTGGLLALSAGAMEPRIAAMSVQGIFGDMRYHFIRNRHKHCQCGAIPGLLGDFNLPEMVLMATPTPIQICNSRGDSFDPGHAAKTLDRLTPYFEKLGIAKPEFRSPGGGHEFQVELALDFFERHLRSPRSER